MDPKTNGYDSFPEEVGEGLFHMQIMELQLFCRRVKHTLRETDEKTSRVHCPNARVQNVHSGRYFFQSYESDNIDQILQSNCY